MSLVGKRILVEYNVGGLRLYYERLVVEWIREETYVVVMPDRDIYAEDPSISNPDIRTLKMKPSDRGLPAGVVAGEVYALPRWGENQLRALREEAARVAQEERGSSPPAAVVAPVLGGADGGALKWVGAEAVGQHALGKEIPVVTQQKVRGFMPCLAVRVSMWGASLRTRRRLLLEETRARSKSSSSGHEPSWPA